MTAPLLNNDCLSHVLSRMDARGLCTMRLVTQGTKGLVDTVNEIWMCLSLREGLRPMTSEELKSQTYQEYFRKNWAFVQLKNGQVERERRPRYSPNCRMASLMQAAFRGCHPLASAALENAHNKSYLLSNFQVVEKIAVCAIGGPQEEAAVKMLLRDPLSLDRSFLRAVSKGRTSLVKQIINCQTRRLRTISPHVVCSAFYLAAGLGHMEIVVFLREHFQGRINQGYMTHAYSWAEHTGHREIAHYLQLFIPPDRVFSPADLEKSKTKFRNDFREGFLAVAESGDTDLLECLLQQKECVQSCAQNIIDSLELDKISVEMAELLLNHEQFEDGMVSKRPLQLLEMFSSYMYGFSFETMTRVVAKVCQNGKDDLEAFYRAYGKLLSEAVEKKNLELVKAMLSNEFPKIPQQLTQEFITACHLDGDYIPFSFSPLLKACRQYPNELAWFLEPYKISFGH